MSIVIGLIIIAIGAFCQSSCYVPINRIKAWSWESYWLVQGVFAWLVLPLLGALLAVPSGHSLFELFTASNMFNIGMTILFGVLWGVGGLTFGLSMRYLGVALGQSISLGTCAGLGTILGPVMLNFFYPEGHHLEKLTGEVCTAQRRREARGCQGFQLPQRHSHRTLSRFYECLLQCRTGVWERIALCRNVGLVLDAARHTACYTWRVCYQRRLLPLAKSEEPHLG